LLQQKDEENGSAATIPWTMINAAQTIEQVHSDIWDTVQQTITTCADQPIKAMWDNSNYEL
jgi:thymidylate kinase